MTQLGGLFLQLTGLYIIKAGCVEAMWTLPSIKRRLNPVITKPVHYHLAGCDATQKKCTHT